MRARGHKAGGDAGPVSQRHARLGLACQDAGKTDAGAEIDICQLVQMRDHLAPQKPVRQVPAKGLV